MAAVLALTASLCYGISNFIGPALSRGAPVYVVLMAGQAVALAVSGLLTLATGAEVGERALAFGALAGLGNAAGLVCFYRAVQFGPVSIVTPIGALGASVPVAAGLLSGEPLGALKAAGIAMALSGVALVARRQGERDAARAADRRRAVLWALVSAAAFGVFLAAMAPASEGGVLPAVFTSRLALLAVMLGLALVLRERLRVAPGLLPKLALPGVLLFAGTLAYSAATRRGDLSVVSVLGTLFPVVTVALAFAIDRERLALPQAAGVALAIAGSALLGAR